MKKEIRRFKVDFNINWSYGVEIKQIREDLDKLEKLGVTSIDIETEDSCGNSYLKIEAFTVRIETDEEFKIRVDKENQKLESIKERELKLLETLKSKYENLNNNGKT